MEALRTAKRKKQTEKGKTILGKTIEKQKEKRKKTANSEIKAKFHSVIQEGSF